LLPLAFLAAALVLTACADPAASALASSELQAGDCVSVSGVGSEDAAPVRRVPCAPAGTVINDTGAFGVYRIVFSMDLAVPVTTRAGADDLARLYCRGPEVVPGSSLYVFPTKASFDEGFTQFLCLTH
jgi:hypothetical protein